MSARSFTLNKRRQGNITVERDRNSREVYLHGNLVVKHDLITDEIYVSNCGWSSPTTRVAINRYFDLAQIQAGVYQSKHEQFLKYGQELISLCDNGGKFTFFPNTKNIASTDLSKAIYKDEIVADNGKQLTIRS